MVPTSGISVVALVVGALNIVETAEVKLNVEWERSTLDYGVFVSYYYVNLDALLFGSSLPIVGFQNITHENITIDIPGGNANGSKSIISGSHDDNRFDEFKGPLGIHGMALNMLCDFFS